MTQKIERFMQTKLSFDLGKNEGYTPSSLRGRSIVVIRRAGGRAGRQAGRQMDNILTAYKSFKIHQLQF